MKTVTTKNHFLSVNYKFQKPLCERKSFGQWLSSSFSDLFGSLVTLVIREVSGGLVASRELAATSRYLVGVFFMVCGVISMLFHHLFNSSAITDRTWFFISWYEFFFSIRLYLITIFFMTAAYFAIPVKWKIFLIPFSIVIGFGIANVINCIFGITFQVHNLTTQAQWEKANLGFHGLIGFDLILIGVSLALGFLLSMNYLIYRYNHYRRGLLQRFVSIWRSPLDEETKRISFDTTCAEFDKLDDKV